MFKSIFLYFYKLFSSSHQQQDLENNSIVSNIPEYQETLRVFSNDLEDSLCENNQRNDVYFAFDNEAFFSETTELHNSFVNSKKIPKL